MLTMLQRCAGPTEGGCVGKRVREKGRKLRFSASLQVYYFTLKRLKLWEEVGNRDVPAAMYRLFE